MDMGVNMDVMGWEWRSHSFFMFFFKMASFLGCVPTPPVLTAQLWAPLKCLQGCLDGDL